MSAFNVDASTKNVAPVTPRQQSGLTLLEVMVALLIFALTGTAVLKAAGEASCPTQKCIGHLIKSSG